MTYIIAEVGSNWETKADCVTSVAAAKECGADAVKFQLFTHEDLYGLPGHLPNELPEDWLFEISCKAKDYEIDFMCTVFNPTKVSFVNEYVTSHKIASSDSNYIELLKAVAATGKHTYLSVGASTNKEIEASLSYFQLDKVTLMHCSTAYPSRYNWTQDVRNLRTRFKCNVGFSDHTIDVTGAPYDAVHRYKATAVEKHFRLGHIINTPDAMHSLTPSQFKDMVGMLKPLGGTIPDPESEEFREKYKRRQLPHGFYRPMPPGREPLP